VGHVELDVVLGQDQGVAFGADLRALAGDRAVGGEDGQVLAGHEGAGARFAGGVVLRAVPLTDWNLQKNWSKKSTILAGNGSHQPVSTKIAPPF